MAKITTITNPLTGQPVQVDQLEHTAQQIDDAIARALPSTDYPGCYYRTVDGVVEWFNPPMQVGGIDADGNQINEYRTTERYLGKPVYAKVVDFGPLPNNTEKQVKLNINGIQHIVECSARYSGGDRIPSCNTATSPTQEVKLNYVSNYNGGFVRIASNYDASASGCYVSIKYTKTTD